MRSRLGARGSPSLSRGILVIKAAAASVAVHVDAEKCGPKRIIIARGPPRYDIIKSSWARGHARYSQLGRLFLANVDPPRSGSSTRRSSIMSYDRASRLSRQSRPRIERPLRASRRAFSFAALTLTINCLSCLLASE